jgi:hypothetical protein
MFQRSPKQQEPAQLPEKVPEFVPSALYDRLQNYSNSFFLSACSCAGILAVNAARANPAYRDLVILMSIAAIATLAFFPNESNKQTRRIGIIALIIGVLLGFWESILTFNFQLAQVAIAVVVVLVILAVIGWASGDR